MVSRKYDIKLIQFKFVLRYKGDKYTRSFDTMFRRLELGIWASKSNTVGCPNFIGKLIGDKTHVPSFMIGVDLLLAKFWIDIDFGKTLTFEI